MNKRLTATLADGATATCLPFALEDGRSARTFTAIVLHYDHDYDLIAQVGGPRSDWVGPTWLSSLDPELVSAPDAAAASPPGTRPTSVPASESVQSEVDGLGQRSVAIIPRELPHHGPASPRHRM